MHPDEIADLEVKRADLEAAEAIKLAADKIMEAAVLISKYVKELMSDIKSLANRNYREFQMSSNAMRQLVSSLVFIDSNLTVFQLVLVVSVSKISSMLNNAPFLKASVIVFVFLLQASHLSQKTLLLFARKMNPDCLKLL